jgi:CubicO group peptidase (beta-lactamase class C family)
VRTSRLLAAALAIAASYVGPSTTLGAQRPDVRKMSATVDSIVTTLRSNRRVPGISVLIAYGDKPAFVKSYGVADLDDDAPATAQTIYFIASITKQFTAATILQLRNEHKLSLHDTVTKYFTDLPIVLQPVTIRQLLNHTSGLRPSGPLGDRFWSRRDYTREEWLRALGEAYRGKQPDFAPGTAWSYRDVNYMALAYLIEKVTGHAVWDEFRQRFFVPLGMTATAQCNLNVVVKHRAKGYVQVDSAPGGVVPAPYLSNTVALGNSGLCSNVTDLFTWQRALVKHRVLDSATYAMMSTPGSLDDGTPLDYAMGLAAFPLGRQTMLWHTGGGPGFTSFLGYLPAQDATIIVLGNSNMDPLRVGAEFARAVAGLPQITSSPLTQQEMQAYLGTYEGGGIKAIVRPRNGELEAEVTGTQTIRFFFPVRLMKQSDTAFLVGWEPESRMNFSLAGGAASAVTLSFGSRTIELRRSP